MIRRIGNQAYRLLSEVLDLPGADNLGSIQMAEAQPCHDLDAIIKGSEVLKCRGYKQYTQPLNTSGGVAVTPWDTSNFDELLASTPSGRYVVTEDIPRSWDVLLLDVKGKSVSGTFESAIVRANIAGVAGAPYIAISNKLNDVYQNMILPDVSNGAPYYACSMPRLMRRDFETLSWISDQVGGTAHTTDIFVYFLAAPPGVIKIPGDF